MIGATWELPMPKTYNARQMADTKANLTRLKRFSTVNMARNGFKLTRIALALLQTTNILLTKS